MEKKSIKEKVVELTSQLERGLEQLGDSETYKKYLKCMSKFHGYSYNNTILIMMQKPEATYVAGFNTWKNSFNRVVKKGEKGIKILAPAPFKTKVEQDKCDSFGNIVKDNHGNPLRETVEITIPKFKPVTVFDISQTEGEPIPELSISELEDDVDAFLDMKEALVSVSRVPIVERDIDGSAKGYFSSESQEIVIREGMPQAQTIKTMIHEIAHSELHDYNNEQKNEVKKDRNTKEVEAESVAYTVCAHFGINTDDYSFAYILGWSKSVELKEFKASLETIQKTSNRLIGKIESALISQKEKDRPKSIQDKLSESKKKVNESIPKKQNERSR